MKLAIMATAVAIIVAGNEVRFFRVDEFDQRKYFQPGKLLDNSLEKIE